MKADTDFSALTDYISELGLDITEMETFFSEISFFDSSKIQSVSNIASMLVKHILLENMLKPAFDKNMQKAVTFINENLENDLSIRNISKSINVSKSVLYKRFHACFNCTISEYINTKRIEKSIELLTKTDMSIEEISQKSGFASASYYSKTFKKIKGVAPLKFRFVGVTNNCSLPVKLCFAKDSYISSFRTRSRSVKGCSGTNLSCGVNTLLR